MNKETKPSVWDTETESVVTKATREVKGSRAPKPETPKTVEQEPLYDLEGLMTDFPTAKELEKFVFDQSGIVLQLKGRSNKFKYQTAMDVLNGAEPDAALLGSENPYLDKNDLIPVDEPRPIPARPGEVVGQQCVASFISKTFPHPDNDWKSQGQKCEVVFRKYMNNAITYEIIGPISTRPVGTRVNKFGKEVPEKYTWVDPRTGEQIIRSSTGMLTPIGTRLRQFMTKQKINKSDYWSTWIDRDFVIGDGGNILGDPWGDLK